MDFTIGSKICQHDGNHKDINIFYFYEENGVGKIEAYFR